MIAMLMMDAMSCNPGNWSAFQGECSANSQEVFNGFGDLVSPVHEEPMIAHPNARIDGDDIQDCPNNEVAPTEEKSAATAPK